MTNAKRRYLVALEYERSRLLGVLVRRRLLKGIPLRQRCEERGFGPCYYLGRGTEARCAFCGQPGPEVM